MILAFLAITSLGHAATSTWSYNFNMTVQKGGDGFYALSASETNPDTLTTTINSLSWSIWSSDTKKYAVTASGGQTIGTASAPSSHTSLFTYDLRGKVLAVRLKARRHSKSDGADLKVSIGGQNYLCESASNVALTEDSLLYEFKPSETAQSGKVDIEFLQTGTSKNSLYLKSIEIEYEPEEIKIKAPSLSLAPGSYDAPQTLSMSVEDYTEGSYTILYTFNNGSPLNTECNPLTYTEPIKIEQTTKINAVTKIGDEYSAVVKAEYSIRQDPRLSFAKDTIWLETTDYATCPMLNNPRQVSPIKYKSTNNMVAAMSSNGEIYARSADTCSVMAIFEGNDEYIADTASFVVVVVEKVPLNLPTLSPMGGTFDGPVEVNISVVDDRAKTIWYSITATDSIALTDDPIIIPATEGVIKITKSCHLLVLAAGYNVFSPLVEADFVINEKAQAMFSTDEAYKAYYTQGFDSSEEIEGWLLHSNSQTTFRLMPEPSLPPYVSFSTIDPNNKYSLDIKNANDDQNEIFESPAMTIEPNSQLEFYSYFSGGLLVWANWTVGIYDHESDKSSVLVNGFEWAQENNYTGPAWIRFNVDLSDYEGHKVQFYFIYQGSSGEAVAFDGFKLMSHDFSSDAQITVNLGDTVHYHDMSVASDYIEWEFPGGRVINEDEHNPIVVYDTIGSYDVSLYVMNQRHENDNMTRHNYVNVVAEMPKAIAELPHEGYLSPFTGVFLPLNVPVTFHDCSTGRPTERLWKFQGTDIETSTESDPTVTYIKAGTYSVELQVSNVAGTDQDILRDAIQAGGAQYIWNIQPSESSNLDRIAMGYFGKYAGSNWLLIDEFAEHFKAPLADATIDSVMVYFASTETISPDSLITVRIRKCTNNLPGEVLASASVRAGDLNWDDENVVGTSFILDKTAHIEGEFFVSIGGFPHNALEESPYTSDNISVLCARRAAGQLNTVYHYLDTATGYEPSSVYEWMDNDNDPLSMAIAPVLNYGMPSNIENISNYPSPSNTNSYMIDGQAVSSDTRGLVIRNGRVLFFK